MRKILIVYFTKTGSTKGTGNYIKSKLDERFSIEVKDIKEVKSLEGYSKIILGAPINGMKIVPEMRNFIEKNHNVFLNTPTYFYIMTYAYNNGRPFFRMLMERDVNKIIRGLNISPYFIGGVSDKPMPSFAKFIFGLPKDEPLDNRDFTRLEDLVENVSNS